MSIFIHKVKYFLKSLLALTVVLVAICFLWCMQVCRFPLTLGEDRVFYLQSASSQGLRKEVLNLQDFSNIRGESVRFYALPSLERGGLTEEEALSVAEQLASEYGASIVFTEKTAEVISFYCHTARWLDGVFLYGRKINLHIAIDVVNGIGVLGSPIIFDGY